MSQRLAKFAALSDGRIVRILCGAEGEGDPNANPQTDPNVDPGAGGAGSEGEQNPPLTVSAEEFEKMRLRMQAADRAKSEAEKKVREHEDAKKSTEDRLSGQVETLTKENENLKSELATARRDNAFLTSNGVTWHDAKLALGKIDWDSVTDSGSGEVDVTKLRKEIERVAKDNPFLVKTGAKPDEGKGEQKNGPSGHQPQGGGGDKKQADRAALEKKYPALRR